MTTLALHLNKRHGYTCQSWLSTNIADRYFGGVYRVWFATSINPKGNGHSSNPLVIYQEIDHILQTNDHNHSRIDQLRQRMTHWIAGSALIAPDIATILNEISTAPVNAFRPQLWRIDLGNIHICRLINLGQYPDEYQISDLISHEFEVIVQ